MENHKLLNRQNAEIIRRISQIIAVLSLAGAGLIFFFVSPPSWSLPKVESTIEQRPDLRLPNPPYDFTSNRRLNIFAFGNQNPKRSRLIKVKPVPPTQSLPGPNATGLILLGTMPGKNKSFVIIKGLEGKRESVIPLGGKIRKSLLNKVSSDSIVLTRNAQNTTLKLNTPWRSEADRLLRKSDIKATISYTSYAFPLTKADRDSQPDEKGMDIRDLDIFMTPLSERERKELELAPGTGLRVIRVGREDIDVNPGDLLVAVSGKPVGTLEQILTLLKQDSADDIKMTLVRSGRLLNIRVAIR